VFTVSGGEEFGGIDFSVPPGGGFHVSGKIQEVNAGTGYSIALTPVDQPAIAAARVNVSPDGSFRFEGIPSGRYYALVTGPVMGWGAVGVMLGDAPVYGRGTVDVVGQDVDGLALSLGEPRGVTIAMRAGSGCPGSARVVLRALEDWGAMFNWSATVAMGEERRFERLPPERFLVTASDPAERCFPNSETTVDLTGGQSERAVVVQLVTAGAIHGRLVGTERGSDFVVVMVASDPAGMTGRVQATFSDAGGRFNISGLHPGTYRIAAQAATGRWIGDLAGMMEIDIRGGSPTDLELPVALGK
jgi:hypothetical protein